MNFTKIFSWLIPVFLLQCQQLANSGFITHPVTISFNEYINETSGGVSVSDSKVSGQHTLTFQGFAISTKTLKQKSNKILHNNSDISYFVVKGALLIGQSKAGNIIVEKNGMYIVPRNIEHFLVPWGNEPVKLIIHQSHE